MSINDNKHFINRKKMLLDKGIDSQADLARKANVTPQALSNALRGVSHSWFIHRRVCEVLGVQLAEFWPEFYGPINKVHDSVKNAVSHDSKVNEINESVN